MNKKLFNINDARAAMDNLSTEQADRWTRIANIHYQDMKKKGVLEVMARNKAVRKANEEVKRLYGKQN